MSYIAPQQYKAQKTNVLCCDNSFVERVLMAVGNYF